MKSFKTSLCYTNFYYTNFYLVLTHPLEAPSFRFLDAYKQLEDLEGFNEDSIFNINYISALTKPLVEIKRILSNIEE